MHCWVIISTWKFLRTWEKCIKKHKARLSASHTSQVVLKVQARNTFKIVHYYSIKPTRDVSCVRYGALIKSNWTTIAHAIPRAFKSINTTVTVTTTTATTTNFIHLWNFSRKYWFSFSSCLIFSSLALSWVVRKSISSLWSLYASRNCQNNKTTKSSSIISILVTLLFLAVPCTDIYQKYTTPQ